MPSQLQLLEPAAPKIDASEIARMCLVLDGAGWLTADQLAAALFDPLALAPALALAQSTHPKIHQSLASETAKRRVRAIANASDGRILSYPGSPGYKLTKQATLEEIVTATAKLRHQAGEMHQRALQIDRVYHGKKL